MNYKSYFFEELKKRIFLVPFILLVVAGLWFVNDEVNILNVSVWSLLLVLFLGAGLAAFMRVLHER